jgi:hypothetical protein
MAARHLALYGEPLVEDGMLIKEQKADIKKNKEAAPEKAKKGLKGLFSKKG